MHWEISTPERGNAVRVNVKFYYHYGIFIDDEHIVQFGLPDNTGINPDEIAVIVTDAKTFLNGEFMETGKYSHAEKIKKRSDDEIVNYALKKVGQVGYNILHNNCEHFVNECIFGESRSTFLDEAREKIKNLLNNNSKQN